jgi:predicted dithiol-disulfide oxidoreductase (DUF899 family)
MSAAAQAHRVVSREQWNAERVALLAREKELTRMQDAIASERRALPWVRMDEPYVFDTREGRRSLAELFGHQRQLVMQHFMLAPGWEAGCPSCSYMADHTDAMLPHLAARGIAFVAVSRAPIADIERFRRRMGWTFTWVSSHGSPFNRDFGVSFTPDERASGTVAYNYGTLPFAPEEMPGISAFCKDESGAVFHTYSTYGRGVEAMMGTYRLIDLTSQGRGEEGLDHPMAWVKHHDRYEPQAVAAKPASCCGA